VTGKVTIETLQGLVDAFNAHDLDAVMSHSADDAVLEMPRGPHPCGRRLQGREEVRSGLASRFAGIPDVHYGDDRHWVSGDRGCSEWLLSGTTSRGIASRYEAATCSSSRATRSPGRIPTGSSSSAEVLPRRRQRPLGRRSRGQELGPRVRWATAYGAFLAGNDTTATGQPTSPSRDGSLSVGASAR
jgi:ketosteroid isomerase-like protein